jgi:hypothetical protein
LKNAICSRLDAGGEMVWNLAAAMLALVAFFHLA